MSDPKRAYHELGDDALLAACRIDVFRAGGKGGQHQNTTNTGAESRTERSQLANRRRALARLRDKLREAATEDPERIPTRVPRREKRRRLENKRRRSQKKRRRRPPDPEE